MIHIGSWAASPFYWWDKSEAGKGLESFENPQLSLEPHTLRINRVSQDLFAEQQCRRRHREQTYGQGQGEEGEGEISVESSMDAYILTYVNSRWRCVEWLREIKWGLCNNLERWEGAEGRRQIQEGKDICTPMVNSYWWKAELKLIL